MKESRYRRMMVLLCTLVALATAASVGWYAWRFEQNKREHHQQTTEGAR